MSTKKRSTALKNKADFRLRRKQGLVAIERPWAWLTGGDLKALAVKAYHVSSHNLLIDTQSEGFTQKQLREFFVQNLSEVLRDLLFAQAITKGGCWPVDAGTPLHLNYPQIAASICADVPPGWRPQYPVYKLQLVRVEMPGCDSMAGVQP